MQLGPDGDGVQTGDSLAEHAQLQAALGDVHIGLFPEDVAVGLARHLQQLRVRLVGELRSVEPVLLDRRSSAGEGRQGAYAVEDLVLARGDRRRDGGHQPGALGRGPDGAQVVGALHDAGHDQAPAQHAVGDQGRQPGEASRRLCGEDPRGSVCRLQLQPGPGVGLGELDLDGLVELAHDALHAFHVLGPQCQHDLGIGRDRVVLGAAVWVADADVVLGERRVQDAGQHQYGVRPLQVDVELAVPADQAAHLEQAGLRVCAGHGLPLGRDVDREGHVTAAAGEDLLVGDPVEVDHPLSGQLGDVELLRPDLPLLLHRREHRLERRVRDVLGVQEREDVGDTDPVVGPERGAVGGDVVAVDDEPQPVGLEVVRHALVRLAHHVEVAVQDERGSALEPVLSGLLDQHAVQRVLRRHQPTLGGEVDDPVGNLLLVARPAGERGQDLEEPHHLRGLERSKDSHSLLLSASPVRKRLVAVLVVRGTEECGEPWGAYLTTPVRSRLMVRATAMMITRP